MNNKRTSNRTIIIVAIIFFPVTGYWFLGWCLFFISSKFSQIIDILREYSTTIFTEFDEKEISAKFHTSEYIGLIALWPLSILLIFGYLLLWFFVYSSTALVSLIVNVYTELTRKISSQVRRW